jgi:hypothetical protein
VEPRRLNVYPFNPIVTQPDFQIYEDVEAVCLPEHLKFCGEVLIGIHVRVADECLRHRRLSMQDEIENQHNIGGSLPVICDTSYLLAEFVRVSHNTIPMDLRGDAIF